MKQEEEQKQKLQHEGQEEKHKLISWKPDKSPSKGAIAYHEAVSNSNYYIAILDEIVKIVAPKIKKGDVVVDFGAGTGVSSMRLLDHLDVEIELWLVDNSPAWLGKAYEVLNNDKKIKHRIKFFIMEKTEKLDSRDSKAHVNYATLSDTIGTNIVDHVFSANTLHLVPNLEETFKGIASALKDYGTFTFQSVNINLENIPYGALLIDDTVKRVHDIAIEIVRRDQRFECYRDGLDERINMTETQKKFVFPNPRNADVYLSSLKSAGFIYEKPYYKLFKVKYSDWLNFLRVRRLQAGILPEIGGNEPSSKEESDRDTLITLATKRLFDELRSKNPLADEEGFIIGVVYVTSKKSGINKVTNTISENYYDGLILLGKNAFVSGTSSGIGKAIAIELARKGANVVINYNKNEKGALETVNEINKIKREIKKLGIEKEINDCIALKADVSNFNDVKAMFDIVKKEFENLDILINNAGIIMDKTLQNMDIEEWQTVIKTNLEGVFNVTRNALPLMKKEGRIINISSVVALDGNFGQTNYAASKAGIIGFTKSLAKELGKYGITVNAIAPGLIETDIIKSIPSSGKKELLSSIPINRIGTPQDVANLVIFLASNKSSFITGEVISINGGFRF